MDEFVFLLISGTIISIMGRYRSSHSFRRQRGDTIVEVLISVVVIATILTGAFVVSQASSRNVRSSQEHSYALQQVQAQIEAIRSLASSDGSSVLKNKPQGYTFCAYVDSNNTIQLQTTLPAAVCAGGDSLYKVVVTKGATASDTAGLTTFAVAVDWDKLGGGTNHESMIYGVKLN